MQPIYFLTQFLCSFSVWVSVVQLLHMLFPSEQLISFPKYSFGPSHSYAVFLPVFIACRYLISLILLRRLMRQVDILPPSIKHMQIKRFLKNGDIFKPWIIHFHILQRFYVNHFQDICHQISSYSCVCHQVFFCLHG